MQYLKILADFALLLWAAVAWTIGYFVAPLLFHYYPKELAGQVVGILLGKSYMLGYVCLTLILLDTRLRMSKINYKHIETYVLIGLAGLLVAQSEGITPYLAGLKLQIPFNPEAINQFGMWHGISQILYLTQSLLLLFLVWRRFIKNGR